MSIKYSFHCTSKVTSYLIASANLSILPWGGLDHGREAAHQQVPGLADVDNVEDDSLILLGVLDAEVEPKPAMQSWHGDDRLNYAASGLMLSRSEVMSEEIDGVIDDL